MSKTGKNCVYTTFILFNTA